jgi:hypothetical protein
MIPPMAARFEAVYTDDQRDAIAHAYEDRRIRPARRVVELAAAGELEINDRTLEPFTCSQNTVRDFAAKLRKRRAGEISSQLAKAAPRDAIESLRRRLVNAADAELAAIEKRQKNGKSVPGEELRQVARAVREIAAIPGPNDARPAAPGARVNGERDGAETKAGQGLAGKILHAHRTATAGADTAHNASPHADGDGEHGDREDAAQHAAQHADQSGVYTQEDGSRGLGVRVLADAVGVELR